MSQMQTFPFVTPRNGKIDGEPDDSIPIHASAMHRAKESNMNDYGTDHTSQQQDLYESNGVRSMLDQLLDDSRLYTQSKDFKELLEFVVRLRNFAPFNAMLLQVQKRQALATPHRHATGASGLVALQRKAPDRW